jgi:hypothetical protein
VIDRFGGIAAFEETHKIILPDKEFEKFILEHK